MSYSSFAAIWNPLAIVADCSVTFVMVRYTPSFGPSGWLPEEGGKADEERGLPTSCDWFPLWLTEGQREQGTNREGSWLLHPSHSQGWAPAAWERGHHSTGKYMLATYKEAVRHSCLCFKSLIPVYVFREHPWSRRQLLQGNVTMSVPLLPVRRVLSTTHPLSWRGVTTKKHQKEDLALWSAQRAPSLALPPLHWGQNKETSPIIVQ